MSLRLQQSINQDMMMYNVAKKFGDKEGKSNSDYFKKYNIFGKGGIRDTINHERAVVARARQAFGSADESVQDAVSSKTEIKQRLQSVKASLQDFKDTANFAKAVQEGKVSQGMLDTYNIVHAAKEQSKDTKKEEEA